MARTLIARPQHVKRVRDLLTRFPVVALLGARQVGKTTLARQIVAGEDEPTTLLDLEDPTHRARLADPMLALSELEGLGFEFKRTSAPKVTRSMHVAREDLRLDRLEVVYPGDESFPLTRGIRALSIRRLQQDLEALP